MNKYLIIALGLLFKANVTFGENDKTGNVPIADSIEEQSITIQLDSLTGALFNKYFPSSNDVNISDDIPTPYPAFADSVLIDNLVNMTSEIPLAFNPRVKRYIQVYSAEHREKVRRMLGLKRLYFSIFEESLDFYNLPQELRFLPIIESALNPNAVSRAGATGLWQLMYSTGKMLGLKIDSYVDERRDPHKSTDAAVRYLRDLHKIYDDWLLVIAAYNCGPGNLNKAIARSGGKRNIWQIMPYLPKETRGYVPAFIGALYVMNYYEDYGYTPINPKFNAVITDSIVIKRHISLSHLSKELGLSYNELVFLNPALKKKIVPASKHGYTLFIPLNKIALYETNKDSIFARLPNKKEAMLTNSAIPSSATSTALSFDYKNKKKLFYAVKSGDNLGYIAEWYDCSAQDLRNWNGMYGNTIKVGKKLAVYVPTNQYGKYLNVNNLSFDQKQSKEKNYSKSISTKTPPTQYDENCDCIYHEVKNGDTLWDISRKYRVSIESIKKQNDILNTREIKPGMVLRIGI